MQHDSEGGSLKSHARVIFPEHVSSHGHSHEQLSHTLSSPGQNTGTLPEPTRHRMASSAPAFLCARGPSVHAHTTDRQNALLAYVVGRSTWRLLGMSPHTVRTLTKRLRRILRTDILLSADFYNVSHIKTAFSWRHPILDTFS